MFKAITYDYICVKRCTSYNLNKNEYFYLNCVAHIPRILGNIKYLYETVFESFDI